MKNFKIFKGKKYKNKSGFTLIELVMTIVLTGILSVGLYEAVIFGINDYMMNEYYLHSNNSMTYAISLLRRNLVNAAMPPSSGISPSASAYCPLSDSINPATPGNAPVVRANLAKQTETCGGTSGLACNEIAFYQNINTASGESPQLVVFCVRKKILYEEVTNGVDQTTQTTQTTPYPVANNISDINF